MLRPDHVRRFVIIPALHALPAPMGTEVAVELLLGTALKESGLVYLKQGLKTPGDGQARALGLFQMEPVTHADLQRRFLAARSSLAEAIEPHGPRPATEMLWDLRYATQMARLKYWSVQQPLPTAGDVEGMARCWAKFYNTKNDPKEIAQWVTLYTRYA